MPGTPSKSRSNIALRCGKLGRFGDRHPVYLPADAFSCPPSLGPKDLAFPRFAMEIQSTAVDPKHGGSQRRAGTATSKSWKKAHEATSGSQGGVAVCYSLVMSFVCSAFSAKKGAFFFFFVGYVVVN